MLELQDTLLQIEDMLNRAAVIEDTVYEDYLTEDTCDTARIEFGYPRIKTLHEILGDYLVELQRLTETAVQLSKE